MKKTRQQPKKPVTKLSVAAPVSVLRAGRMTWSLLLLFILALCYLTYTLVTESPYYMAMSGKAGYGIVYDRKGDVLFDGTRPLSEYPDGHFADVGSLIGDTSGQMSNTLVARNRMALVNYSFMDGAARSTASIETTLLHSANRKVFDALGNKNGTVIACNWKTGEILVCVSKPCVDIAEGYANIATMPKGSLLCKAFYPTVPGSTQKVSTLIAAYETCGVEEINSLQYDCSGAWLNENGQRINCHKSSGHGTQTTYEAFRNSCNPFFAQLVQSKQLPLSRILRVFTNMGYGVNGEKADALSVNGITASAASLTLTDDGDFDTQWACLGQGDTLISPLQLMLWQSAIANGTGTAMQPYLIACTTSVDGKTVAGSSAGKTKQMFSAETAVAVRTIMMENAQAQYSNHLGAYSCGAKSGTAQVTEDGKEYENSLLAGFCTDNDLPIAFCIVIENRKSGELTTAQVAGTLLKALDGAIS
ncbi:MAG: penicillin-binding transpeptidase domain-containing protein [Oscillospiraceae bacterium]|nr:penicillin-binding transpeptidase domain-containing protein [Oscillospiraceae bacterium]